MWSVDGRQVVHQSGLSIEVLDGSFSNPLDLSVKGDKGFSAPELALMIREGMEYAAKNGAKTAVRAIQSKSTTDKPKRPILKLKK
ncbi:hypothetical protein ACMXYV_02180 [Neptuniibacter sp. SY11_33]|uniref:hypothetical protein n=1 Tax=Neptuniibacter sp. SY11_33 TaxID=3398215 RepID=UPI0039F5BDFA